jgi:hypothetical protein
MNDIETTTVPLPEAPTPTLQGIAPDPDAAAPAEMSQAEKNLIERARQGALMQKTYNFRGEVFRLRAVMPAQMIVNIGDVQSNKNVGKFIDVITDLFHKDDAERFRAHLLDANAEIPVDVDFLSDAFAEISKIINGRGLGK